MPRLRVYCTLEARPADSISGHDRTGHDLRKVESTSPCAAPHLGEHIGAVPELHPEEPCDSCRPDAKAEPGREPGGSEPGSRGTPVIAFAIALVPVSVSPRIRARWSARGRARCRPHSDQTGSRSRGRPEHGHLRRGDGFLGDCRPKCRGDGRGACSEVVAACWGLTDFVGDGLCALVESDWPHC